MKLWSEIYITTIQFPLKYGFCKKLLRYKWNSDQLNTFGSLFFQISADQCWSGKKVSQKCSTAQSFICTEVTSYEIHILTQEPIHEIFTKNIENWRVSGKWPFLLGGHFEFCIISMKTSSPFIWGIIYFCTMDGFFRILEKTSSELICTRL